MARCVEVDDEESARPQLMCQLVGDAAVPDAVDDQRVRRGICAGQYGVAEFARIFAHPALAEVDQHTAIGAVLAELSCAVADDVPETHRLCMRQERSEVVDERRLARSGVSDKAHRHAQARGGASGDRCIWAGTSPVCNTMILLCRASEVDRRGAAPCWDTSSQLGRCCVRVRWEPMAWSVGPRPAGCCCGAGLRWLLRAVAGWQLRHRHRVAQRLRRLLGLAGVDPGLLDPVLLDYSPAGRAAIKAKYLGDVLIAGVERGSGLPFVEFFQRTCDGQRKGIVLLNPKEVP